MDRLVAYTMVASLLAFTLTVFLTRRWIEIARGDEDFLAPDMNKPGKPLVARAGGVWAIVSIAFALLVLVMLETYVGGACYGVLDYMALALLLTLTAFLGLVDDLLGWKRGLRARYRVLLMIPISLPMVVIKAGVSTLDLPFLGPVDLGLVYPLLIVPLGVLGAANAFNMLAGYNGLEAGMGALLLAFTAAYAGARGICGVVPAAVVGVAALAGFLVYNWYPARTFPGNAFTYAIGAYYASLVILGNFEKFGVTLFALYFLEFALFIRGLRDLGGFKENFGEPQPDGTLKLPSQYRGRVYSVTHLAIVAVEKLTGKATEKRVVLFILALQAITGVAALLLYL